MGCCFQDLFRVTRSILVYVSSSFFSNHLVSVDVVQPYRRIEAGTAWKNFRFNLSVRSDFHMVFNLSMAVQAFPMRILMSRSVDDMSLPRYVNCSTDFRGLPSSVEMSPCCPKHMYSVLSELT